MPGGFYVMKFDGVGWPPWEEFNGDGLRDRTRTKEKPEGWTRVAILGDSVTLGAELSPQEAYPQLLEARFAAEGRRAEVMNVALWGWSTRQQRIAWQKIARQYRPDQAVLAICLNDIPELFNNLARPPRWLVALHERSALVRLLVNAEAREIDSVERLFSEPDAPRVRGRAHALLRGGAGAAARGAGGRSLVRARRAPVPVPGGARRPAPRGAAAARRLLPRGEAPLPRPVADARSRRAAGLPRLRPPEPVRRAARGRHAARERPAGGGRLRSVDAAPGARAAPEPGARSATRWLETRKGAPERAAVAAIAVVLDLGEPSERQAAAWALGVAGPVARPLVPALARRLQQDGSAGVRASCARALAGSGSRAGMTALFAALDDPSEAVRAAAAQALSRIGPTPQDVPALVGAVASRDRYVAAFAAWSLGNLGAAAEPAVDALARALAREDTDIVVASALARIGPAAHAAVPELVRALGSDDDALRWRAARTLGRIGPAAEAAVAPLVATLADPNGVVRAHAARALGRIGAGAKPAAAALQRATGDREVWVRDEAREALERLTGRPD